MAKVGCISVTYLFIFKNSKGERGMKEKQVQEDFRVCSEWGPTSETLKTYVKILFKKPRVTEHLMAKGFMRLSLIY